jgi:dihydropteroate synthase
VPDQTLPGQPHQQRPQYEDVVAEVCGFFQERMAFLESHGVVAERMVLDPGFGFGKTLEHNRTLLQELPELAEKLQRPLLVGLSRKSLIGHLLEDTDLTARLWPTVALTAHTRALGARVHRVHDVRLNEQALRMMEAILQVE